jgi:hypothetical protein
MTKEELEKEAEEWLCNNLHFASEEDFIKAMVDFAEPREKQIQIDAEHIIALQKQNGELTDKVKELEIRCNELFLQTCEQAEKVKELEALNDKLQNCWNCKKSFDKSCSFGKKCEAKKKKCKEWEIKEK